MSDNLRIERAAEAGATGLARLRAILARIWRDMRLSPDPGMGDHIGFAPLADLMEGRLD